MTIKSTRMNLSMNLRTMNVAQDEKKEQDDHDDYSDDDWDEDKEDGFRGR